MTKINDLGAVVAACQAGDKEAQERLILAIQDRVYYHCLKVLKHEQDALDATQDVLITVITSIGNLREPAALWTWVNTITANRCKRNFRGTTEWQIPEDEDGKSMLDDLENLDDQVVPEAALDNAETRRLVMGLIDALPPDQKLCVMYYYYDEMSVGQIAQAMNVPEGTVKSRLNYARKSIKAGAEKLEKEGAKLFGVSAVALVAWSLAGEASASAAPAVVTGAALAGGSAAAVSASAAAGTSAAAAGTSAAAAAGAGAAAGTGAAAAVGASSAAAVGAGSAAAAVGMGLAAKIALSVAGVALAGAVTVGGYLVATNDTAPIQAPATPSPAATQQVAETGAELPGEPEQEVEPTDEAEEALSPVAEAMYRAMLSELERHPEAERACLLDMDNDGVEELLFRWSASRANWPPDITEEHFVAYRWNGSALEEYDLSDFQSPGFDDEFGLYTRKSNGKIYVGFTSLTDGPDMKLRSLDTVMSLRDNSWPEPDEYGNADWGHMYSVMDEIPVAGNENFRDYPDRSVTEEEYSQLESDFEPIYIMIVPDHTVWKKDDSNPLPLTSTKADVRQELLHRLGDEAD